MSLFNELKRRNVFRVGIAYIVVAWLVAQVLHLIFDSFGSPDWVMKTVLVLMAAGLPLVLFFAWAFELTPDGLKRESEVDRTQSVTPQTGRKLDRAILAVLVVAIAYFAYDKFILDPQRDAALVEGLNQAVNRQESVDSPVTQEEEPARTGPPMLAVLPFVSSSLGGDSEFFASGVHDDLLTQLAQLQSIRVISRTSVLEYRDSARNIREIGKALGADAILEGGVQSAGDQIRINAQLIDTRTDEHLWAQTYDRELSPANIFEVQTEIARAITSALQATLTTKESTQLAMMPTENMAAYRAYHRAIEIRDSREGFDALAFQQALEEAVALDPTFTRAWAELVGILCLRNFGKEIPESLQQAEQALQQIRTLAPESADYLIAQAFYTYYILRDFDQAHQQINVALAVRPSDPRIVEVKSWIERRMGDLDSRIESLRLARTLDPRNPRWTRNLIRDLMIAHRYDEASAEVDNSGIQDYELSYWHSVLQLREHQDIVRWVEDVTLIQNELGDSHNLYDLWEAHIANREYEAAEDLANVMQDRPMMGAEVLGRLSDQDQTHIVTYWFMKQNNRLAKLLVESKAKLDERLKEDGDAVAPALIFDLALVAAAEGNTEETERLIRQWRRRVVEDLAEKIYTRHYNCRVLGMAKATAAAVDCIRTALAEPSLVMPFMEVYLPYYDAMRNEPEFVALLAELSTPDQKPN